MFEAEAYMEVKRIIYQLYKAGKWDSLTPEIQNVYKNNLKYWYRRLGNPNDNAENQDNTLSIKNNKQVKKPDRKKYYDHPFSLDQAHEELGYEPADSFSMEDYVIRQETYQELHAAIRTLDEQKQEIIEQYYFEEQTEREIGNNIGKAQRVVNYQKDKSHKELEKIMKELF